MRIMVTGSRSWGECDGDERKLRFWLNIWNARRSGFTLVHGACPKGADRLAAIWADGEGVPSEPWPADWNRHGRRAGFVRNSEMVASLDPEVDAVLTFWDGESRGAKMAADLARAAGLRVRDVGRSTEDQS